MNRLTVNAIIAATGTDVDAARRIAGQWDEQSGAYLPYAEMGGYPVQYLTRGGEALCAACANGGPVDDIIDCGIAWEGCDMPCADCGVTLRTAYGCAESGCCEVDSQDDYSQASDVPGPLVD